MTLLDRFRAQPRHKHPDVAVRLAYVAELPLEDREAILAMAREDAEPGSAAPPWPSCWSRRRLADVLESDPDDSVRSQAVEMLRDIALEAFEGIDEAESLVAVDTLTDGRIARPDCEVFESRFVALRAVGRVADARTSGPIARHAVNEAGAPGRAPARCANATNAPRFWLSR